MSQDYMRPWQVHSIARSLQPDLTRVGEGIGVGTSPTSAVSGARASDFKRLTPRVGTTLGAPRGACGVVLAIGDRGAPARSLGRDRGARRSAIALRGREAPPSAG